jgi:hypothetical protein
VSEKQNQPFQFSFNASLRADFQGSPVMPDGNLVLARELDARQGTTGCCRQKAILPGGVWGGRRIAALPVATG